MSTGLAPVGTCRVRADRGGSRGDAVSGRDEPARRGRDHAYDGHAPRATPHRREPCRTARVCAPQKQGRRRDARCDAASAARRPVVGSEGAGAEPPGRFDGAPHLRRYGVHRVPQATTPEPSNKPRGRHAAASEPRARAYSRSHDGAETRANLAERGPVGDTNRSPDEAAVIDRALTVLVEQLEKEKYGRTDRPRPAATSDPAHVMSLRICDARSADATAIDVPLSGLKAVVPRRPGSSSITACRSRMAGRRPSTISNCAARRTTPTKPSGGSGRCSCGRPAARGACPPKRVARRWANLVWTQLLW